MKRRIYIIVGLAVVLLTMARPTCAFGYSLLNHDVAKRHDTLCDGDKKQHQRGVATFDDATSSLRLCLTRPSRLLPTTGPAPGKQSVRQPSSLIQTLVSNLLNCHSCRKEASPFPTAVSRNYYVIALRHILC
ncbi:MAG: hypothetical protein ACI4B3_06525 [Prevotella sp.]